jgi:hypothetical protein
MRQRTSLTFVFDTKPCCGEQSDELLAAVEGSSDRVDAVAEKLVRDDVAVTEVCRDHQHTIVVQARERHDIDGPRRPRSPTPGAGKGMPRSQRTEPDSRTR